MPKFLIEKFWAYRWGWKKKFNLKKKFKKSLKFCQILESLSCKIVVSLNKFQYFIIISQNLIRNTSIAWTTEVSFTSFSRKLERFSARNEEKIFNHDLVLRKKKLLNFINKTFPYFERLNFFLRSLNLRLFSTFVPTCWPTLWYSIFITQNQLFLPNR